MTTVKDLQEQEYMSLADGVGVVPEQYRNKGYDKLPFGPGEGGIAVQHSAEPADDRVGAFLAGVAAGADPKELADKLLGSDGSTKRKRG